MARSSKFSRSPFVALLLVGFAGVAAQEPGSAARPARAQQPTAVRRPPTTDMQELLLQWEGQSKKLQTLELSLYRVDKDPKWGDEEHYLGHAAFKNPQLAFLDFRKVKMQEQADPNDKKKKTLVPVMKDKKPVSVPFETLICTGKEIWQYRYDVKQVYIFPLDKDQRKRALEEGPLPFLFNMRAADANQRYAMRLLKQDETGYLVEVKPLLKEDQETFSIAYIYLDSAYLLPKRISLLGPDRKSSKHFQLSNIKANQPVNDRLFVGVNPGHGFKLQRNPGGQAPATNLRARRQQLKDQTAKRLPADDDADQPR